MISGASLDISGGEGENTRLEHLVGDTGIPRDSLLDLFSSAFGSVDTLWPANQRWLFWWDDRLVGHAAVQRRWFIVDKSYFEGWFVGAVCTEPSTQRRGIGTELMRRANADLAVQELDFAVLNCGEPRVGFYERAGYKRISERGLYLRGKKLVIDEDPALAISLQPDFDVNALATSAFPFGFDF